MRALVLLRWPVVPLAIVCSLAWSQHAAMLSSSVVIWQQYPATASVIACDQSGSACPSVPVMSNGAWLNGTILAEMLSNQSDPHGLGAYEVHLVYDPTVFRQPAFADAAVLDDGGLRSTSCAATATRPGDVTFACFSSGPFGVGASWTGARVVARMTLVLQPGTYTLLRSSPDAIINTTVRADAAVTNTCGQPLNDGSIQPIPGQVECQGNLLSGVEPGGVLSNVNPATLSISLGGAPATATSLTDDFNGDCVVNGLDLRLFARHYLTGIGSLLYSPLFDLNGDAAINVLDLQIFAAHFAQHC
jgi:hypothetical protein